MLSILSENWHTWYLGDGDFESGLRFSKFRPQIYFWANLGRKSESCPFCLKIGTHTHTHAHTRTHTHTHIHTHTHMHYTKDFDSYFLISILVF